VKFKKVGLLVQTSALTAVSPLAKAGIKGWFGFNFSIIALFLPFGGLRLSMKGQFHTKRFSRW